MKKIVVGIDGSKESFDSYKCAASLFPGENITLTSVFVRDERKLQIPFIYSGAAYDIAYERLYIPVDPQLAKTYEKLNSESIIFADKCIKMCENMELSSNIKQAGTVLEGDPAEVLREYSNNSDLLVLGQRGENAAYKRELIGSTSEDLIRKTLIPVLVCPGDKINLDRILIIHEGGISSDTAIDYYIKQISSFNSKLTVLIKDHFDTTSKIIEEKLKSVKQYGVDISLEECTGSIAHTAIKMMESGLIDTFLLGSHGKHKLTEYLLGSSTVHIIRKSSIPVFIIH